MFKLKFGELSIWALLLCPIILETRHDYRSGRKSCRARNDQTNGAPELLVQVLELLRRRLVNIYLNECNNHRLYILGQRLQYQQTYQASGLKIQINCPGRKKSATIVLVILYNLCARVPPARNRDRRDTPSTWLVASRK